MAASIKRIGELMRQVYRDFACGLSLGEDAPDAAAPYWSIASSFSGERPASSYAHALAFLHLLQEEGFEGCIYRFGIPDLFTHCGVIAQSERGPVFFDAHTGVGFGEPLNAVLDKLDQGVAPKAEALGKDRKVCVVNLEADPAEAVGRLAATADRELVGLGNQRAFLVAWNAQLYAECCESLSSALDILVEAGGVRDFADLLLCPLEVIDGKETYTDIASMPVIGAWFAGRDGAEGSGASKTAAGRRRGGQRKQLMQAARMASTNRIIEDLRRDLDQLRREGQAQRAPVGRSYSPRTSATNLAEIAELQAELEAAQLRAQQAEAAAKRFQAEHARLLDQSVLDHGLTQEALRKASDEVRTERTQRLELEREHDRSRHEAERLGQEAAGARRQLDEERAAAALRAADLQRRLDEAVADHAQVSAEHRQLGADHRQLSDEHRQLGEEHSRLGAELDRSKQERATTAARAADLQQRLDELVAAHTRLNDEHRQQSAEFERSKEERAAAAAQAADLQQRLDELVAAHTRLNEEHRQQGAEFERSKQERATTAARAADLQQRLDELAAAHTRLNDEHRQQSAEFERSKEERAAAAARAVELQRRLDDVVADYARLRDEQAQLSAELDRSKDERSQLARERERLLQEIEHLREADGERSRELERERRRWSEEQEGAAQQIERLERRLDQLQAAAEDGERDTAERDARIADLTLELETLRSERDARIAVLTLELETLQSERDANIQTLTLELETLRSQHDAKIEALNRQLESLNQEFEAARADLEAGVAAAALELEAARAEQGAVVRRQEEERKLMQVAQARLERELRAANGELSVRDEEVRGLASTIARLAYTPSQGQPVVAPDLGADARTRAAERVEQRIAELEHARAVAEAALQNHREILLNSRYFKVRKAMLRLVGRSS